MEVIVKIYKGIIDKGLEENLLNDIKNELGNIEYPSTPLTQKRKGIIIFSLRTNKSFNEIIDYRNKLMNKYKNKVDINEGMFYISDSFESAFLDLNSFMNNAI